MVVFISFGIDWLFSSATYFGRTIGKLINDYLIENIVNKIRHLLILLLFVCVRRLIMIFEAVHVYRYDDRVLFYSLYFISSFFKQSVLCVTLCATFPVTVLIPVGI